MSQADHMYIAHEGQSLLEHLSNVARLGSRNAVKIQMAKYGELLGLLHDFGKYSNSFQNYIRSALGSLNPDMDEEYVDAADLKGKIDHSTAGAQFVWRKLSEGSSSERILAQVISLCLASHHSGLIDCLTTGMNGVSDAFGRRINKSDDKSYYSEVIAKAEVLMRVDEILGGDGLVKPFEVSLKAIFETLPENKQDSIVFKFQLGLLVRFLFSCLIDADRQDTADSEKKKSARLRQNGRYLPWDVLIDRLENHLTGFEIPETGVNRIRADVSTHCLNAAARNPGLFSLTVPTGGGKTLASLRFALHHAKRERFDRVIYVIPFTSIIDQNAAVVRRILEVGEEDCGRIVLEHHSNIGSEEQSWKEKLLCENWDAPVIYTTMVQFLETFFGGGTRGSRRMHQLANSVIVFDEIQTLPIRCVHLFCNAVNFLTGVCGSSVVLCTATQPLLGKVDPLKGALQLSETNEIMPNVQQLFDALKRVAVKDVRKPSGWSEEEIASMALEEVSISGSCLVVVNMKRSARNLVKMVKQKSDMECFHLSTGMCPAHRKKVLAEIREKLASKKPEPVLCVSTQLIEAGVDIDFGSVIRYAAGLDSIAQAAGRCNRHGERDQGRVFVVNPSDENIDCLKDIAIGKEKTDRVLNDFKDDPERFGNDLIGPVALDWYYQNYFFGRKADMDYPVSEKELGRTDTLLNLLSSNPFAVAEFQRVNKQSPGMFLRQSFKTAGRLFKSIDAPTQSVIVQYGADGKSLVADLCGAFEVEKQFGLLKTAQQFSVNLFPHEFRKLDEQGAIFPVQAETEIFYLDQKYYSDQFGISMEPVNEEEFLHA